MVPLQWPTPTLSSEQTMIGGFGPLLRLICQMMSNLVEVSIGRI